MIRPLGDRVLIKFEKTADRTPGGLFIPDTAKEKPVEATVVAVGSGRITKEGRCIEPSVKTGDRVLVEKWAQGTEVDIDGVKHVVLPETNILGVLG